LESKLSKNWTLVVTMGRWAARARYDTRAWIVKRRESYRVENRIETVDFAAGGRTFRAASQGGISPAPRCRRAFETTVAPPEILLSLWIEQTEGRNFWLRVINDLNARGVNHILIASKAGSKNQRLP
jgi:hypothetical protein